VAVNCEVFLLCELDSRQWIFHCTNVEFLLPACYLFVVGRWSTSCVVHATANTIRPWIERRDRQQQSVRGSYFWNVVAAVVDPRINKWTNDRYRATYSARYTDCIHKTHGLCKRSLRWRRGITWTIGATMHLQYPPNFWSMGPSIYWSYQKFSVNRYKSIKISVSDCYAIRLP
jgi:hypothetical protein